MDDLDSLTVPPASVRSRFVSQDELDSVKARRDEQWKAAYARLGQEPPPQPQEDVYDGRSLAEKLAANKAAKQEEWEERSKLANQFRSLEEDEVVFLDSIMEKKHQEERKRKLEDAEEVQGFREAVAARNSASLKPPLVPSSSSSSLSMPSATPTSPTERPAKKQATASSSGFAGATKKTAGKNPLKGVIVKKKKPSMNTSAAATSGPPPVKDGKDGGGKKPAEGTLKKEGKQGQKGEVPSSESS